MTQYSNILSFDQARQGASSRRVLSRGVSGARGDRYAGLDYYGERYGKEHYSKERYGASSIRVSRGGKASRIQEDEFDGELTARQRRAHLREQAKRSRAKAKAERAFVKQFGTTGASDAGEGSSRAAVYKGEMGTKHRQAARMQTGDAGSARSFGFSLSGVVSAALSALKRPRTAVCASVVVCLFLSASFLYPSARTYYQAIREEARLEVEYQALAERNEALERSVAYLQTNAGVEDRARSQYGWVKKGEQAGKVSGIEATESEASVSAKVLSDEIEPPETWYSKVLDPIFGVS
ncbi:FtsB family cell division protein [Adlercreutzia sp. ZJ141]|uniref:FtsB family cell division protein n=1 Tax=Adlercreutzia sp. ZJ141 TaxID=2709406 RepID=UPI0013ED02EF|nr:septum formation initiator family protein [Adlercreutzia sp. ZJ141]